jgi:RNA polymerase sigma-70 factor (ECF subfamily)
MHKNNIDENELVARVLNGDENAFATIFTHYKDNVYTTLRCMNIEESFAEDLLQDTFIKALEGITNGKYTSEDKLRPWLCKIASNLALDHHRSKDRQFTTQRRNTLKYQYKNIAHTSLSVEDYGLRSPDQNPLESLLSESERELLQAKGYKNSRDMLDQILEELPAEQKEIVILRYYLDASFRKASIITSTPLNTCLGRMRYALINIRKIIEAKPEIVHHTLFTELVQS